MHPIALRLLALTQIMLLAAPLPVAAAVPFDVRTIDGTDNNASNASWGARDTQLLRVTSTDYFDDISEPRGGNSAVSARAISNAVAAQTSDVRSARELSDMFWTWGQFIDHDIDLTDNASPAEPYPIAVPAGDPHFDPFNTGIQEIGFNRSVSDPTTGTDSANPREQLNQITAYLDASNVYGSDATRQAALRTGVDGLLKTSTNDLLPFNTPGLPNAMGTSPIFFLAGDVRANEQPTLTALHTLFVREHNRIAAETKAADGSLSDDDLYETARRKVGALIQRITYNEFLPAMFGSDIIPTYSGYNSTVDPSVSTEFSTAAYRLGHSMISPTLLRLGADGLEITEGHVTLQNAFFNPNVIQEAGIDPVIRGAAAQIMMEVDTMEIDALRNFLFGPPGAGGFDLVSLNIQRGRDHGIAGYNQARRDLGLSERTSFSDITSNATIAAALDTVYAGDLEAVDLWVAGLAEDHIAGSSVGETFTAILKDQFTRLRNGDRFWYQSQFTGDELSEIESTTLKDVIERNTGIVDLQDNVFFAMFPEADLEVEVELDALTLSGSLIEPDITLKNLGPLSASGVSLTVTIPANLEFIAAQSTPSCAENSGNIECTSEPLDAQATFSPDIVFKPLAAACFTTVSVSATSNALQNDSNSTNDTGTDDTFYACPGPDDLDLGITVGSSVSAQRTNSFTSVATITNNGPADATSAIMTFAFPSGLIVNSISDVSCTHASTILCENISLAAQDSHSVEVEFTIPEHFSCPVDAVMSANISGGNQQDYFSSNNDDSATTAIECEPENDMSITLKGESEVELGNTIEFTASSVNNGPAIATKPVITFALPTGLTFSPSSSSSSCEQLGATIECPLAPLDDGIEASATAAFVPLSSLLCGTTVATTASIASSERETNPSNNTSQSVSTELSCAQASVSPSGGLIIPHPQQRDRDHDTVGNSNSPGATRGKGTNEARLVMALLCRRNGMDNAIVRSGHFRLANNASPMTPHTRVASDREVTVDGYTQAERNIICGMKRYMEEQDPRKRKTDAFKDWVISELSRDLHKSEERIRQAIEDPMFCKTETAV